MGLALTSRFTVAALVLATRALAQPAGPQGILPLPPDEMVQRMTRQPFQIVKTEGAGGGVMGAQRWTVRFDDGQDVKLKWKKAPADGEGWNNSPRFEMAAYAVQQLFLDRNDQVVPPAAVRCVELNTYAAVEKNPAPNLAGTRCVFGGLAAWLTHVHPPSTTFDYERFSRDRAYAYRFGNLNLLTYLIAHRDARANNFLVSDNDADPQIFSIDNGISFGTPIYNWFMHHFDHLQVAGLPRAAVERLQRLSRQDVDALETLAQLQRDDQGVLRDAKKTANLNPERGTRITPDVVQIGLTRQEIAALQSRLELLLAEVRSGKVQLF